MLIRFKNPLLGVLLVAAIGGLSACGGSSSDGVYNQAFDVSGRWSGNISQHNRQSLVPVTMTLAGGASITGTISATGHTCVSDGNVTGTASTAAVNTNGDNPLTADQENSNLGQVNLAYALTVTSGGITAVTIDSGGTGYTSEPSVVFAEPLDPTGRRAEGKAIVAGGTGGVGGALSTTLTQVSAGSGYTSVPTVSISAPPSGGTTATAVATIGGTGQVASVGTIVAGNGYSSAPTVTISAPESSSGITATAVAVLGDPGRVVTVTCSGGAGYATATTTITINDPDVSGGVTATATPIVDDANGDVEGAVVTNPGSGYNIIPGVTVTGAAGSSGAICLATLESANAGQLMAINVTNPGSGYIEVPSATLTGGGGSGAGGTPVLTTAASAGTVTAIDLIDPGSGYMSVPAVVISGGGGTGARYTAALAGTAGSSGQVTGVIMTDAGSGYDAINPPLVTFSGGGGSGAMGHGTTLSTSPAGAMTFNLSGTSSQLSGHYSGIWNNETAACSVNTSGTISLNRS